MLALFIYNYVNCRNRQA